MPCHQLKDGILMHAHIDLFTGLGGFSLAARANGIQTVVMCEADHFVRAGLKRAWPGIPIIEDVREFTVDSLVNAYYNRLPKPKQEAIDMGVKNPKYDTAVLLYNSGLSIQNVADFYGITRQAMWMILKRRGCVFRDQKKCGKDNHFTRNNSTANRRVHHLVDLAIQKGILTRKTHCEKCQSTTTPIIAHHSDYNLPLDVVWLCKKCHYEWHKNNSAIELKIDLPKYTRSEIGKRGPVGRREVMPDELLQKIEEATATYILTAGVP